MGEVVCRSGGGGGLKIRCQVPQKQRKPPITGRLSYTCRILLIGMLLPASVSRSWTESRPVKIIPQTEIIHIFTHPGRRPTQTSHPGGLEVHIKVDYRVDEASAKLSASRHTAHYFWPRCVDTTHGLSKVSEMPLLHKNSSTTQPAVVVLMLTWLSAEEQHTLLPLATTISAGTAYKTELA